MSISKKQSFSYAFYLKNARNTNYVNQLLHNSSKWYLEEFNEALERIQSDLSKEFQSDLSKAFDSFQDACFLSRGLWNKLLSNIDLTNKPQPYQGEFKLALIRLIKLANKFIESEDDASKVKEVQIILNKAVYRKETLEVYPEEDSVEDMERARREYRIKCDSVLC